MQNYLHRGDVMKLAAPYDRLAGQGALIGKLFGVAVSDVLNTVDGEFAIVGVFSLTKKSGDTPSQGALLYWDDTNKYVTTTSTSNTRIGVAAAAAGSSDATVDVRLNGVGAPTGA